MPDTEISALSEIRKNYNSMSLVEKKIADFILANPEKTVNMAVARLASAAGVSEGSVIRFANKLGFDGFIRLKINLASHRESPGVLFESGGQSKTPLGILRDLKNSFLYSADSTIDSLTDEALIRTAKTLMKAKRIEIYGVGSSLMIAQDAYYRLLRTGLPAYSVADQVISAVSASMLDEKSAVIAVSYSGKTESILRAAGIAKQRGAAVIGLTAYSGSPLAKLSDIPVIIIAKETENYNEATVARLTQLMIIDALCHYIAQNKKGSVEIMENVVEILNGCRRL